MVFQTAGHYHWFVPHDTYRARILTKYAVNL